MMKKDEGVLNTMTNYLYYLFIMIKTYLSKKEKGKREMDLEIQRKYAKLIVEVGVNVQKGQILVVNSITEAKDFTRLIVEEGYKAGAKSVNVIWSDPYISRYGYDHKSLETLKEVPNWNIERAKYLIDNNACIISITSPILGINQGVEPVKLQTAALAQNRALRFVQEHMMANHTQWCVIAVPNKIWAKKVFPDLEESLAVESLWKAILNASRVTVGNNPIEEWKLHNTDLVNHNELLTKIQFDSLHFRNGIGTDFTVRLVNNHIWSGGIEKTTKGISFNPNIPTEENFTMPHKYSADGKVVATKPLNYQGKLIEDFWLVFKEGKVVEYGAKKHEDALKNLLEFDKGSSYLGEVALISYDSPINNTGLLFFNTLFDENASCHLALGRAYPFNTVGGTNMNKSELEDIGCNQSMVHVDFMFGSIDMEVIGVKKDGSKVAVFKKGNYVI